MEGLRSPDLPAFVCYLLVFAVGMLSSRNAVNKLLDSAYGRWSFVDTWVLFYVQTLVPVALFWFLDYSGVVHDTSLFAALLVAAGYQQIFAGGVKNITMPGETAKLWQPFEAWRNAVADRIARAARQRLDRFDRLVAHHAALETTRLQALVDLAFSRTADPTGFAQKLQTLATLPSATVTPAPTVAPSALTQSRMLVLELRATEPKNYGAILAKAGLVPAKFSCLARFATPSATAKMGAALGVLLLLAPLITLQNVVRELSAWQPLYLRWRLTKADTTAYDRFRTREQWLLQLRDLDSIRTHAFLAKATAELRSTDMPATVVDELIGLAERTSPEQIRAFWLRELIEGMQTLNVLNRAKLHAALLYLAPAACPGAPLPVELNEAINPTSASPEKWRAVLAAWRLWMNDAAAKPESPPAIPVTATPR